MFKFLRRKRREQRQTGGGMEPAPTHHDVLSGARDKLQTLTGSEIAPPEFVEAMKRGASSTELRALRERLATREEASREEHTPPTPTLATASGGAT